MIEDWSKFPKDRLHLLWAVDGARAQMSATVGEIVELVEEFEKEDCTIRYKNEEKEFKMSIITAKGEHKCNYFITNFTESDITIIIESIKNMKR
jgi:hypothetical protein